MFSLRRRLGLMMFATFALLGIKAPAQDVLLECKIEKVVLDGQDITARFEPGDWQHVTYMYNAEREFLRYQDSDCSDVTITSVDIRGACGRGSHVLDRTNGHMHATYRSQQGCIKSHWSHGDKQCDEYRYETLEHIGTCRKGKPPKEPVI